MNVKNVVYLIVVIIGILILLLFVFFIAVSPGKINSIKDADGNKIENAVVEKIFVEINGRKHGMFISSTSADNPVLLFIHGGPGMPEFFLHYYYPTGLEKNFTICWMEQRGAGLSYSDSLDYGSLHSSDLVDDIKDVSIYLKNTYNKEKIFLSAHSWGSYIALQAVVAYPELFNAYIGIAQITNQKESELIAFDYMMKMYTLNGKNKKAEHLRGFEKLDRDNDILISYTSSLVRDESMHDLGIGSMRSMKSVVTGIFMPSLAFPGYTINEKITLWRAKSRLNKESNLQIELMNTDLRNTVLKVEIPVIFMSGKYDYTVNHELSKNYFDSLQAPQKEFLVFNNSAHSPLFEERQRYANEMSRIRKLYE